MPLAQHLIRTLLFTCASSGFLSQAPADETLIAPSFAEAVEPLLRQHCYGCHGEDLAEGNLRLDTLAGLNKGGNSGQPVIPGKPGESLLITAVRRTDELLKMPPEEKLSDDAVRLLTEWVQSGAVHPDGKIEDRSDASPFDVEEARKFWAFQEIQSPAIPSVSDSNLRSSPIDAFIVSRLNEHGLTPNPVADKATLIRRATFDLTGLPPLPEEIARFLADDSPEAFAKVIDRLLSSQQYGERWGRHWLDVVRYADSNGLDENIAHGNAWRYRNYVINSFNSDKPYDQFLREQIAGDLLVDDSTDEATRIERLTATGFYSLGPKVLAEGDETKLQMDILDEQIDTMGRSMLGLTLGCARCHDHKFDPIAQADYYALAGIFQSTRTMESLKRIARWNENSIATTADKERAEQHRQQIEAKKQEISSVLATETARVSTAGAPSVPEGQLPADAKQKLSALREELKQLEASLPELPTAMGVVDGDVVNARILIRGNHLSQGRMVPRGVPVVLTSNEFRAPEKQSGRLQFADWLTSPQHPLTARVIVNRVWRWHFGRGLVATADNFGKLGERPTNPELLDWLATEFIRSGWSMKSLHRTIMLSRTWQLSNVPNAAAEAIDPDNHLQWRWTTQRLEAEAVRDSVLAVTGRLDRSMGQSMLHVKNREFLFDHTSKDGTSYDSTRRSVYLPVIRNNLYDAMSLFDCTDGTVPNGDRASSTVASQALFFMNSDLVIKSAEHLAKDLMADHPDDIPARIQTLFMKTLGRPASEQDVDRFQTMASMLDAQLGQDGVLATDTSVSVWTSLVQTVLMSNEFLYVR